jgi:hypothetical protein
MKIGIITFHCADNYGAVLQTMALYQKLTELFSASEIYIVDYRPESITKTYAILKVKSLRQLAYSILQLPFSLRKKYSFNKFRNSHFKLINLKNIDCLDYIVCGSDQIWNSKLTDGPDPHFFGVFEGFAGKAISYAASDGGNLTNIELDTIQPYLAKFEFVSIRERSMFALLKKHCKNIFVVLDPVFLPGISFWKKIATGQRHSNYILIYQLSGNDRLFENAYQLAVRTGRQLIEITYGFPYKRALKIKHKVFASVSLPDFLSLFIYADYIFTNSFHGTALSIILNKPFYTYINANDDKKNRLIEDLLAEINLQNRFVTHVDIDNIELVDYCKINFLLEKRKYESIYFLKQALSYTNK